MLLEVWRSFVIVHMLTCFLFTQTHTNPNKRLCKYTHARPLKVLATTHLFKCMHGKILYHCIIPLYYEYNDFNAIFNLSLYKHQWYIYDTKADT